MNNDQKDDDILITDIPKDGYNEEESYLLDIRKKDLSLKLSKISKSLENKKDIDTFLEDKIKAINNFSGDEIDKKLNLLHLRLIIKVLGPIFVVFHLIGIFQMNGMMNAVKAEIFKSAELYLLGSKKLKNSISFNEKYNELSDTVPSFSLFFISSIFSGLILNLLGYFWLTIIVLVANILGVIFGINIFDFDKFKISENDYTNYSLYQFLILVFIFIVFYFSIGVPALLPIEIVQKGFLIYDAYKQKQEEIKNKRKEGLTSQTIELKSNFCINDDIEKDEKNKSLNDVYSLKKKKKIKFQMKGYFGFYLFSMTGSLIIQMLTNWLFLDVYENNTKDNLYFLIIYAIPTILSLPFYYCFSSIFKKEKKKNIERKAMKVGGYIIYSETKSSGYTCCKSCGLCCKNSCKQLNYGCCCYLCSCSCFFKSIFCCKCNCDDYNIYNIEKNSNPEIINKTENICIIYKVHSFWFWFFDKILNIHVLSFIPILYLFEIYNIGFKSIISEEKENKEKTLLRNFISLISLFIFLLINKYGGLFMNKYLDFFSVFSDDNDSYSYKKDFKNIIAGIFPLFVLETIYSTIISPLIYYKIINNNIKNYFILFSIGSSEYLKIVCLNYLSLYWKINNNEIEILSSSFTFSLYFIIWNGISFILRILIDDLLFFQFIISSIFCFILLSLSIYIFIVYNCC